MEPKIEIPQALKDALVAAVEKLRKVRPEESYITANIGACLSGDKVAFRSTVFDGRRLFVDDTIEGAVAKVPTHEDENAFRIAELKAELAKLEAA